MSKLPALLLLCCFWLPSADAGTLSLDDYRQHLRVTLKRLTQAEEAARHSPKTARAILKRALSDGPREVNMPDGTTVRPRMPLGAEGNEGKTHTRAGHPGPPVPRQADSLPRLIRDVKGSTQACLGEAERAATARVSYAPSTTKQLARAILDQPEFQNAVEAEWLERLLEWLLNRLSGLHFSSSTSRAVSYWIALVLSLGMLTVTLAYLAQYVWRTVVREAQHAAPVEVVSLPGLLPRGECQRLAREAAKRSGFSEAVRWLMLALIAFLDEKGLASYRPGRTNWQYVRICAGHPDWRQPAQHLGTLFDRKRYGMESCTELDYLEAQDDLERILGESSKEVARP